MIDDISPLDWYNEKFLDFIPPHFTKIKFKHADRRMELLDWVDHHVKGRFAIASESSARSSSAKNDLRPPWSMTWDENTYIAFEDEAEATMFSIMFS